MPTGDITDMVNRRLQQTCDAIASHVYEVSPQKYRIDSMRLGFKKDHLGNLWCGRARLPHWRSMFTAAWGLLG